MKKITILGSTGSIGTQALDVVKSRGYRVIALSAGKNIELLKQQIEEFKPEYAVVQDEQDCEKLKKLISDTEILWGQQGIETVASLKENDLVLNSIVGIAGLRGTVAAIKNGRRLALANKESLVCAGSVVMPLAKETGCEIIPVDSEHSAIFQSLRAGRARELKSVILTASGGPFFGKTAEETENMTAADALKHPSWSMGSKITIDSATLMNKGFEFIEAMWLFDLVPSQIEVVVHRESIIHSAVEFVDGNVIAQLSMPDMRLPIAYAMTYPERAELSHKKLSLSDIGKMTFYKADTDNFRCLKLCMEAAEKGGNAGAVINGANEVAVAEFLKGGISFGDIYRCVEYAADNTLFIAKPSLEDIFKSDDMAREAARKYIDEVKK